MAKTRVKTWGAEALYYQDLNAEFDNLLTDPVDLISPLTDTLDLDGQTLTLDAAGGTAIVNSTNGKIAFHLGGGEKYSMTATIFDLGGLKLDLDADNDTSLQASTDDRLDLELQGQTLFRFDGTAALAVNGMDFQASATGDDVVLQAAGSDDNIDIAVAAKGTGNVLLTGDAVASHDLTVTNDLTVSNDVNVTNDLTVSNDVNVTADVTVGGDLFVDADIVHTGDANNKIVFGTDTQDFQTGGGSRMDLSDSGLRLSGANARVTNILDEDDLNSNSDVSLATQQSIKAYVDAFSSVSAAIYADLKSDGTAGGTFTSGAWQTRDLTTEEFDPDGVASVSASQVTLTAGEWILYGSAMASQVNDHQVRLYNVSDTVVIQSGTTARAASGTDTQNASTVWGHLSVATTKIIRLEHRCETTNADDGFGVACGFGDAEVYAFLVCVKYA